MAQGVRRLIDPDLRARRRQARSLCVGNERLLRAVIRSSLATPFGPSITPQPFALAEQSLSAGEAEYGDGAGFFRHFDGALRPEDLRGRRVLDLGCGYGGRTVYYAEVCGAAEVVGIEPQEGVVDLCRAFAREKGSSRTRFDVGRAEELPFPDASFDTVVSYDVLEHVEDPVAAIHEVERVLRPGGEAWLVFPTYLGARSSHLDYITKLPALHRIFDPDAIIRVVNRFLTEEPGRFPQSPQPAPTVSSLGRLTLPLLNGLTLRDARAILGRSGLDVHTERLGPIVTPNTPVRGARLAARLLRAWQRAFGLPELLISSIAVGARKGGA